MRTSQKMRSYLSNLQSGESALLPELLRSLALGFVEENGCLLLASEARASVVVRDTGQDDTEYECFINHLHIESLAEAVASSAFHRQLCCYRIVRRTGGNCAIPQKSVGSEMVRWQSRRVHGGRNRRPRFRVKVAKTTSAISSLGRSRPAADASREVTERWLLDGFDVSVGHRRCSRDPLAKNDAGGTPAS